MAVMINIWLLILASLFFAVAALADVHSRSASSTASLNIFPLVFFGAAAVILGFLFVLDSIKIILGRNTVVLERKDIPPVRIKRILVAFAISIIVTVSLALSWSRMLG